MIRPYEFRDTVQQMVSFELDLTSYRIDRDVYNVLDMMGDVGGLSEGLKILFAFLIGLMNFHKFEHFLMEHLYRRADDGAGPGPSGGGSGVSLGASQIGGTGEMVGPPGYHKNKTSKLNKNGKPLVKLDDSKTFVYR